MTIIGIETRDLQRDMVPKEGVVPPSRRFAQSSILDAPPFSATRADWTDSTVMG
jgi:hypothetical protein